MTTILARLTLAALFITPALPAFGLASDFQARTFISSKAKPSTTASSSLSTTTPPGEYPMILLLHGGGQTGTDNYSQVNNSYADRVVAHTKLDKYAAFVLVPQNNSTDHAWYPQGGSPQWGGQTPEIPDGRPLRITKELMPTLFNQYSIDTSRLYITGISDGGVGTWDQIARDPCALGRRRPHRRLLARPPAHRS